MFKIIKLKPILIGLALVLASIFLSVGIVSVVNIEAKIPKPIYTIVIDAGHGGRDDGCSGVNGTKESPINLEISKALKLYLEAIGLRVVLTRADGNGLYASDATNYKESDMKKRIEIIEDASPNMVISIHCNSYSDNTQYGAQAFYQDGDEQSKNFAEGVQSQLMSILNSPRTESLAGDYYILKESESSAVLVECGYLSNSNEEALLKSTEYQQRIAYAITCGVIKYFDLCGND